MPNSRRFIVSKLQKIGRPQVRMQTATAVLPSDVITPLANPEVPAAGRCNGADCAHT